MSETVERALHAALKRVMDDVDNNRATIPAASGIQAREALAAHDMDVAKGKTIGTQRGAEEFAERYYMAEGQMPSIGYIMDITNCSFAVARAAWEAVGERAGTPALRAFGKPKKARSPRLSR